MKKSIFTRLIGGTLLLVVAILLLVACFIVGLRVDRVINDDANLLARIQAKAQSVALHVGLLLSSDSPEAALGHLAQAQETNTELLLLAADLLPQQAGEAAVVTTRTSSTLAPAASHRWSSMPTPSRCPRRLRSITTTGGSRPSPLRLPRTS